MYMAVESPQYRPWVFRRRKQKCVGRVCCMWMIDDWVGDPGEGREWSSVGVEAKEVMGREVDDKRTDGAEADE